MTNARTMTLAFTVPGRITGANRIQRHTVRGKHAVRYTSAEGAADLSRVGQLAFVARPAGWPTDVAYEVEVIAFNSRLDADAPLKVLCDGMIGPCYADDRQVVRVSCEKRRDLGGERYEVTVTPCAPLVKPQLPRKMRYDDLDHYCRRELIRHSFTPGEHVVMENQTLIVPDPIPASWYTRAQRDVKECPA